MKRISLMLVSLLVVISLLGCDFIEEQIQREMDRIESLEFVDFEVDIPDRSVLIKITSDVDEQIIEEVSINGVRYPLISQGDDWYLLEDVPIEKHYKITNVYYRSDFGPRIPFAVDYEISLSEALEYLPEDERVEVEDQAVINGYTFIVSDETLVEIISDKEFTIDEIADWVWLILENEEPLFVVLEYDDVLYVIDVPEEAADFID